MGTGNVDPRDLVLAMVAFNEGQQVQGRTLLQKLAYFVNEQLNVGVEFEPYYYGPYSARIAAATDSLVELGFLKEIEERFPASATDIFEPRRYSYSLTSEGNKVLKKLKKQERSLFSKIKKAVGTITSKEECDYESLSLAAKMFHILKSQQKPMKVSEVLAAAKELGWNIPLAEIEKVAKLLQELGLIQKVS